MELMGRMAEPCGPAPPPQEHNFILAPLFAHKKAKQDELPDADAE
jgi:hypothetical protein